MITPRKSRKNLKMTEDFTSPLLHLKFNAPVESLKFSGRGGGSETPPFSRDRDIHARQLKSQIDRIEAAFEVTALERRETDLSSEFGLILNVVSKPSYPLLSPALKRPPRAGHLVLSC